MIYHEYNCVSINRSSVAISIIVSYKEKLHIIKDLLVAITCSGTTGHIGLSFTFILVLIKSGYCLYLY